MSSTDTNQASELFELCKEVYKLTRLGHPITDFERGIVIHWDDGQMFDFPTDELDIEEYIAPLYTSDYLLEKLQDTVFVVRLFAMSDEFVEKRNEKAAYCVSYRKMWGDFTQNIYADAPLKALLKLTIALSEAGELK